MKPSDTRRLYVQRASDNRKRIWPYLRIVAQSGLPIMIGFGGVVFLAFYANLLQTYPLDFPLTEIATALLTVVLAVSPIRTYIQRADSLFLMPASTAMHGYFRHAWKHAYARQVGLVGVAWLLLWPLYRLRERLEGTPLIEGWFWFCTAFLLLVKALSMYASWREGQLRDNGSRRWLILLRWGVTGSSVAVVFVWQLPLAAAVAAIGFAMHLFLISRAPSYPIHWEYLHVRELAAARRIHAFLRGFVDIPAEKTAVSRRRLLTNWTQRMPIRQAVTYSYLYWLQLLRTERLSMLVRLALLAIVVTVIVHDYRAALGIDILVIYLLGLQLTGFWRETEPVAWVHLYPLPAEQRANSFARIALILHAVLVLIITLPLWFKTDMPWYGCAVMLAAGWLWSWRTGRSILAVERKREKV